MVVIRAFELVNELRRCNEAGFRATVTEHGQTDVQVSPNARLLEAGLRLFVRPHYTAA